MLAASFPKVPRRLQENRAQGHSRSKGHSDIFLHGEGLPTEDHILSKSFLGTRQEYRVVFPGLPSAAPSSSVEERGSENPHSACELPGWE